MFWQLCHTQRALWIRCSWRSGPGSARRPDKEKGKTKSVWEEQLSETIFFTYGTQETTPNLESCSLLPFLPFPKLIWDLGREAKLETIWRTFTGLHQMTNWKKHKHASYFPGIICSQGHPYSCWWKDSFWCAESYRCLHELPISTKCPSPGLLRLLPPCHCSFP